MTVFDGARDHDTDNTKPRTRAADAALQVIAGAAVVVVVVLYFVGV